MKKRILKLSFFIFSCLILSNLFISVNVKAEGGATGGAGDTNAGDKTSDCSSWPYKGKINNESTMLRGVRITVVDNDGKVKSGSISVDYVKNTGVTSISNVYYSKTKTTKTMYLKYNKSTNWTKGTVSFKYNSAIANYIISSFGENNGGNMGQNIKDLYNAYVKGEDWAKNIINTIYTDTQAGSFAANDVVLFEPITYVKYCNSAGGSSFMYGTAYELNEKYNGGNANGGAAITGHVAKALYFKGDKISTLTDVFPEPTNTNDTYPGKDVTNQNGWGMGALWIGKIANICDVNVNDNDDKKYNWTYWDGSCDADGDGVKEGCWKKQEDGCCEQVTLTDEILNKYPQCAPCTPNNKTYVNGNEITSINSVTCDNSAKAIINYRGTGDLNKTTPKYCLANNNLLVGIINGKRYGCEITDKLLLPKEYGDDLSIGQYFVWPTSKTLQKLGNFDLRYPLTRTSNVTCVAYKYNSVGQLEYVNLTGIELETVKNKFKTSGNLNLTFNGGNNGNIIEESQKSNFENTGNNLFTGKISTVYTLEEVKGTNGVYAYYDQEKLEYTKTIISSRINKYIQYGFPIIPFGNHKDTNVSITYGINFDKIDLSRLKSYSGSYVCSKKKNNNNNNITGGFCKCEPGTLYEGLDLTPYFKNNYDSWLAECSRVRDLKCNDANTPIKCPNDDTIDMTNCVKNNVTKGYTYSRAYELCVASDCHCIGSECFPIKCQGNNCDLDIIYRPIFLNNPFPSIKGNKRGAGANWGGNNSLNSDGLGTKYITSTASKMYQGEAMYTFTLTPAAIKEIKKYNKAHKYDDFELSCGENQYCTSDVLRGSFSEYFTGGTCQLIQNAKTRGSNDCRLTALNQ